MTKIIAGLEACGLVKRRADAHDGRAFRLEATARGAKLLHEGRRRRVARLTEGLQVLNADEVEILGRAATIIERVSKTI